MWTSRYCEVLFLVYQNYYMYVYVCVLIASVNMYYMMYMRNLLTAAEEQDLPRGSTDYGSPQQRRYQPWLTTAALCTLISQH